MEPSLVRYILRNSRKEQAVILLLTAVSLPFYYATLHIPKTIINQALGVELDVFPKPVVLWGQELLRLGQFQLLLVLCLFFLAAVFAGGGLKFVLNVYKGRLGENLLNRLRHELCNRLLRFPLSYFRRVSQGELISMVTAEVEPLGGFIGDLIAVPALQGGLLFTAFLFIFIQDPFMGLAAVVLYPVQAYVIPRLQRQVNQLGRKRVREVRRLARRVGEAAAMAKEIQAGGGSSHELALIDRRLNRIFDIRYSIFRKKFFIKFLNNFLAQLTPFFFFLIGGYFVIQDELTVGALVAVLAAYKDMPPPWKELLDYYQDWQDLRIKYKLIVSQFSPQGLLPVEPLTRELDGQRQLVGSIEVRGLTVERDGAQLIDDLTFSVAPGEHVAMTGLASRAGEALAQCLVRLIDPDKGLIEIGGVDIHSIPRSRIAQSFAYVDSSTGFVTGTVLENILYGRTYPGADSDIRRRVIDTLRVVEFADDLYGFGLRTRIDSAVRSEFAERIVEARSALHAHLDGAGLQTSFAPFEADEYNEYATVAENLFFGVPVKETKYLDPLEDDARILPLLKRVGLAEDLIGIAHVTLAAIEEPTVGAARSAAIIRDLAEFRSEHLPVFREICTKVRTEGQKALSRSEREILLDFAMQLTLDVHAVGPTPSDLRRRIVQARPIIEAKLPDQLRASIAFFRPNEFNAGLTIEENLSFGRFGGSKHTDKAVETVVDRFHLRGDIIEAGLGFPVGVAGSMLSTDQRQKLGLARALIKEPRIFVADQPTSDLEPETSARIIANVLASLSDRTVVWILGRGKDTKPFDRVLALH